QRPRGGGEGVHRCDPTRRGFPDPVRAVDRGPSCDARRAGGGPMTTARDLLGAAWGFGLKGAAYRTLWEVEGRLGVRELLQPAAVVPVPFDVPSSAVWLDELGDDHFVRHVRDVAESGRF